MRAPHPTSCASCGTTIAKGESCRIHPGSTYGDSYRDDMRHVSEKLWCSDCAKSDKAPRWMRDPRAPHGDPNAAVCARDGCDAEFRRHVPHHKFCSPRCKGIDKRAKERDAA